MKVVVVALAAVALAGCVMLRSEHVVTGKARPPFGGKVTISMDGAPFERPYEEIAIVTTTGTSTQATLPAVLEALKREAASVGANAVVRVRYDRGSGAATATGVAVLVE